jgi:hypothetical protein
MAVKKSAKKAPAKKATAKKATAKKATAKKATAKKAAPSIVGTWALSSFQGHAEPDPSQTWIFGEDGTVRAYSRRSVGRYTVRDGAIHAAFDGFKPTRLELRKSELVERKADEEHGGSIENRYRPLAEVQAAFDKARKAKEAANAVRPLRLKTTFRLSGSLEADPPNMVFDVECDAPPADSSDWAWSEALGHINTDWQQALRPLREGALSGGMKHTIDWDIAKHRARGCLFIKFEVSIPTSDQKLPAKYRKKTNETFRKVFPSALQRLLDAGAVRLDS